MFSKLARTTNYGTSASKANISHRQWLAPAHAWLLSNCFEYTSWTNMQPKTSSGNQNHDQWGLPHHHQAAQSTHQNHSSKRIGQRCYICAQCNGLIGFSVGTLSFWPCCWSMFHILAHALLALFLQVHNLFLSVTCNPLLPGSPLLHTITRVLKIFLLHCQCNFIYYHHLNTTHTSLAHPMKATTFENSLSSQGVQPHSRSRSSAVLTEKRCLCQNCHRDAKILPWGSS